MEFVKLLIIFLIIVVGISLKLKLRDAMILSAIATVLFYQIPLKEVVHITVASLVEEGTLIVIAKKKVWLNRAYSHDWPDS